MARGIESNILKLYAIRAMLWFLMVMPIFVLFLQDNGLSITQVLILQSIFSVVIILFEIPSGYFSDVIGRKKTIIIGCALSFLGSLVYSFSYDFAGFLIAELMLGFGISFLSGTDSAMLYDTLAQVKKEKEYKKMEGRIQSVGNFSEGIASILGGFAALISLRIPFFIEAAIFFLSIPVALSLVEPARQKRENKEGCLNGIIKIVKYSVHQHAEIKWLILYSGFLGASTLTMVWFIQPYFKMVNLPLAYFGLAWAALNFSVGLFSLRAYKYEQLLGRKKSLISLILLSFAGYILLSVFQSLWAIVFIFLFYFVRGINEPVLNDYINKMISSDMRATVLSVKNLISRLIFALVGPLIGWMADVYSLPQALFSAGIIFVVFGIVSLIFLHKYKAL